MGKSYLTVDETRLMFLQVASKMIESKDALTQADKAIGDGDHGIGMARGFEAVCNKIDEASFDALDDLLKSVGMTLVTSIGGAAGAVFGSFFMGSAKRLSGSNQFDTKTLSMMLEDGLESVKARGKAKPGDKTMVDALEPAAVISRQVINASLPEAMAAIVESARQGMENTKDMIGKLGKSKTLGDRSLGHPDPGAISTYYILRYMAEYIS